MNRKLTNEDIKGLCAINPNHVFLIPVTVESMQKWSNQDCVHVVINKGRSGSVSIYTEDLFTHEMIFKESND